MQPREALSVEEEPSRSRNSLRTEYACNLSKVVLGLFSQQVGEDRVCNHKSAFTITNWEWCGLPSSILRRQTNIEDIVMQKLKAWINSSEVLATPVNHPLMDVNPPVT
jgi:hypothetical protein